MKANQGFPDFPSPAELGYVFPPEFAQHEATWLSWPHKEASWPGKLDKVYPAYARFVKALAESERVCVNVADAAMEAQARDHLQKVGTRLSQLRFFHHPTNDAWCRDHGPAFVVNPRAAQPKAVVNWGYNAWGDKYPPYELDNQIPERVAEALGLPLFQPGIVMEGGSIDVNGAGSLLTSRSCLLNPNRNPHLSQGEIEGYLQAYYGVEQILWVDDGIVGDDTDGHVDDTIRFVNADTVLAVVESNRQDDNYELLQTNLRQLKAMRLLNGKQLNVVELPMPEPVVYEGQRLPASYANFYIANQSVIVPTYRCPQDEVALDIIQAHFPDRNVLGLDSTDIIWGLGSFHCLSQQEPAVK